MADRTLVSYGVEWNSAGVVPGTVCNFKALPATANVASEFIYWMRLWAHTERFLWGNGDAWASDFEHPEMTPTGDSLNWVDNANLVYVSAHGAAELSVSLASNHFGCRAYYTNMRLGVRHLRWLVVDVCDSVVGVDKPSIGASVMRVWATPTNGDAAHPNRSLHVVCTLIGSGYPDVDTGRGGEFATSVSLGIAVGTAWLDAAFARSGDSVNRPIAIAYGRDEAAAIARRDHGRLSDRDLGPVEANWLAWKWRD